MHNNVIRLSISKGMMEREGNEDWFLAGTDINDMIVEVEMSYTQFAEAITSLNIGDGIPVTITKVNGTFVEPCPYSDRQKVMRREMDEATRDLVRQLEKRSEEIEKLLDAMLFNVLSYMSNELLTNGHTAACIDEFYLFLTNLTAVEYIRNFMKRVRKKDSAVILASQNLEDFNIDGIREYTKPLFSIPTHVFLFNAGNIDSRFYIDTLQLEQSEYNLLRYPQRGVCLYKCGNERYNLMVHAPEYKGNCATGIWSNLFFILCISAQTGYGLRRMIIKNLQTVLRIMRNGHKT